MKHDQSYETNGLEALQDLFTKEVWIVNDRNNQIWENVISQKERLSVIFYFSVVEIKIQLYKSKTILSCFSICYQI